ncbi:MAG: Gx transporter family protein [Planctomycetes bacterium]|nr:Gx transporter family protein [Planctomycetota bacterium]
MQSHTKPLQVNSAGKTDIGRVACLVSIACVLQISESLIPHPVPGVRLGLANMITLVALVEMGFRAALEISVLRVVLSSLVMGTFLSPTFILSFSGALLSAIIMYMFLWLSARLPGYGFSLIGISVIGAVTHNAVQLVLAYYILIKHPGIFYLAPLLMISAIVMGVVTGLVAIQVILKLKQPQVKPAVSTNGSEQTDKPFAPLTVLPQGDSFLHRLAPEYKIIATVAISVIILLTTNWWWYAVIGLFLVGIMLIGRLSFNAYASVGTRIRRLSSFIFIAFIFPVIFNSGSVALGTLGPLRITEAGLTTGGLFALRIIFLVWLTFLMSVFTGPANITSGIRRILSPFRVIGLSGDRIAGVISLSWASLPVFWEKARAAIRQEQPIKVRKIKDLVSFLSNLITFLYQQGGESDKNVELKAGIRTELER